MAVQVQGNGGLILEIDGVTYRAARITPRPTEYGSLGHYRVSGVTGTLAAALAAGTSTAGHVFAFRWGDATRLAVINSLRSQFLPLTPFTAATLTDHTSFDAFIVRSYSASHTGGASLVPGAGSNKMRASMGNTLATDIRISTTAALTTGTQTFDSFPFAQSIRKGNRVNPAAGTEETIQPLTDGLNIDFNVADGTHPIVLSQNEGIVIRNRTVWPAAGTGILLVDIAWAEVDAY